MEQATEGIGAVAARNIETVQRQRKISDAELERGAGLGAGYLNKLRNIKDPGFGTLLGIANALGVPLARLVAGAESLVVPTLPMPTTYLTQQYGLSDPVLADLLDRLAKVLASQTTDERERSDKLKREVRRSGSGNVVNQLAATLLEQPGVGQQAAITPDNFFRKQYGIEQPEYLRAADTGLRVLAEEARQHQGRRPRRNIFERIGNSLFGEPAERGLDEAGIPNLQDLDPRLTELVAGWPEMSETERGTFHAMLQMLKDRSRR